jgi:DNA-directed RNA polymerase specialized sigma24 family protein
LEDCQANDATKRQKPEKGIVFRTYCEYRVTSTKFSDCLIINRGGFLHGPAVLRSWTFRIASRIAFSHLKRARRWQPLDDAPPEHFTTLDPGFGEPPDEAFLTLLDHVSPASRAVLLLRYQHDLSIEECAVILEIPIGTAKSKRRDQ